MMINGSFESGIPISHVNILIGSPSDQRSHHTQYIHSLAKYLQIKILLLILGACELTHESSPRSFSFQPAELLFCCWCGLQKSANWHSLSISHCQSCNWEFNRPVVVGCLSMHIVEQYSPPPPLQYSYWYAKAHLAQHQFFLIDHTNAL